MKLREFKRIFVENLRKEYPENEVESFFRLLGEVYLNMSRLEMAMAPEKELTEEEVLLFEEGKQRLLNHEPVQYILGSTEFFGLPFKVNQNVLIPRPETEELVEWILRDLKQENLQAPKILDVGTGSGCIAIALAKNLPTADVTAVDVSQKALEVARDNAALNNEEIRFEKLDILRAEELTENFDVIVSNPPYVRELEKREIKPNVLNNEPAGALFVKDQNPLLFYEKIAKLAQSSLEAKGKLYFEINQYLARETENLLQESGYSTELRKDIFGNFRMLRGTL